jgi:transcription antitermination factor NusG
MSSAADNPIVGLDGTNGAWCALHVRHQHEKAVAQILSTKGFETLLPLYSAKRQWKDRVKQLSLPLFPCYLFLRYGFERRLEVLTTPGVHGFVGVGGRATPIPQTEMDAVRQIIKKGIGVEPHAYLRCGDWVRVKSGPLEGIEGFLIRKKNHSRLVISVALLQKSAAVEVDVTMVEPLARQNPGLGLSWLAVGVPVRV